MAQFQFENQFFKFEKEYNFYRIFVGLTNAFIQFMSVFYVVLFYDSQSTQTPSAISISLPPLNNEMSKLCDKFIAFDIKINVWYVYTIFM